MLLYVAGLWLVAGMPLAPVAKALLGLAWSADVAILLARFGRLQRRLVAVCADEGGGLAGAGPAGESFALALLPGSIVTSRLAWLRLQFPDGCRHAELFLERHADAGAWHRFRLVTRLAGRRFGHADRP